MARAERDRTGNATSNAGRMRPEPRRRIPSVDALLRSEPGRRAIGTFGRPLVKRALLGDARTGPAGRRGRRPAPPDDEILARALALASGTACRPGPRDQRHRRGAPHGARQGPAAERAAAAAARGGQGYVDLEVDRESGARGRRSTRAERLLTSLTGAEDALVVNNGAAALLLALAVAGARQGRPGLARRADRDRRRVPDPRHHGGVRRAARRGRHDEPDARVATTVRRSTDRTALILKVHPSNYRVVGFTRRRAPRTWPRSRARRTSRSCSTSVRACSIASRAPRRMSRRRPTRSPTAPTSSCSRATSCSAGRRPAICSGAPTWSSAAPAPASPARVRVDKMQIAALEAVLARHAHGRGGAPRVADAPRAPAHVRRRADELAMASRELEGAHVERASRGGGGALPGTASVVGVEIPAPEPIASPRACASARRPCSAGSPNGRAVRPADRVAEAMPDLVRAVRYALEGDDLP